MRTLVIGGSASGKSEFAEGLCLACPQRVYLATMLPFGEESAARIERHRRLREGKGFVTVEAPRDIGHALDALSSPVDRRAVLLEDTGNLVANELYDDSWQLVDDVDAVAEKIDMDIRQLEASCDELIVVAVDVMADGVAYERETSAYQRVVALLNARLAARFERVVEVACGIDIWLKGER